MSPERSNENTELSWWQGLIVFLVLLSASIAHILIQGGVHDPLTVVALLFGVFAVYGIYDAIEDYRSRYGKEFESQTGSFLDNATKDETIFGIQLERWQADDRSVTTVVFTWFTIAFTVIFALPPSEWWLPVRLFVLTVAAGVIWIRTGGPGQPGTSKERMMRISAALAGIVSGFVIALAVRWLFAQFL